MNMAADSMDIGNGTGQNMRMLRDTEAHNEVVDEPGSNVCGDTVTLRGTVTDNLDGNAAANAARRMHGVRRVVNRITQVR